MALPDPDRIEFAGEVRRMAGVLAVRHEPPGSEAVTVRVVRGHGDRIRRAALAIAPSGLVLHVLEDDLVATVPQLPRDPSPTDGPPTGPRPAGAGASAGEGPELGVPLRCSYVFCHHRVLSGAYGLQAGDRCRQKIGVTNGWLSCPGHYAVEAPARKARRGGPSVQSLPADSNR